VNEHLARQQRHETAMDGARAGSEHRRQTRDTRPDLATFVVREEGQRDRERAQRMFEITVVHGLLDLHTHR
jgi:hypothetical protein